MRMCCETFGFRLLSNMTQKRARGLLRAMSATLQGQWGYTTMAEGVFWWNGRTRKRLKTIAWCHWAMSVGTIFALFLAEPSVISRYILCIFYILYIWMHISDIKIHILHITCLYAYFIKIHISNLTCLYAYFRSMTGLGSLARDRVHVIVVLQKSSDFLSDVDAELKTVKKRRRAIEKADIWCRYSRNQSFVVAAMQLW